VPKQHSNDMRRSALMTMESLTGAYEQEGKMPLLPPPILGHSMEFSQNMVKSLYASLGLQGTERFSTESVKCKPLRTYLSRLSEAITSNRLNENGAYSLLLSVLTGETHTNVETAKEEGTSFESTWIHLQKMDMVRTPTEGLMKEISNVFAKKPEKIASALEKIQSLRVRMYAGIANNQQRKQMITSSTVQDFTNFIHEHYPVHAGVIQQTFELKLATQKIEKRLSEREGVPFRQADEVSLFLDHICEFFAKSTLPSYGPSLMYGGGDHLTKHTKPSIHVMDVTPEVTDCPPVAAVSASQSSASASQTSSQQVIQPQQTQGAVQTVQTPQVGFAQAPQMGYAQIPLQQGFAQGNFQGNYDNFQSNGYQQSQNQKRNGSRFSNNREKGAGLRNNQQGARLSFGRNDLNQGEALQAAIQTQLNANGIFSPAQQAQMQQQQPVQAQNLPMVPAVPMVQQSAQQLVQQPTQVVVPMMIPAPQMQMADQQGQYSQFPPLRRYPLVCSEAIPRERCFLCNSQGHWAYNCQMYGGEPASDRKCNQCGGFHSSPCRNRVRVSKDPFTNSTQQQQDQAGYLGYNNYGYKDNGNNGYRQGGGYRGGNPRPFNPPRQGGGYQGNGGFQGGQPPRGSFGNNQNNNSGRGGYQGNNFRNGNGNGGARDQRNYQQTQNQDYQQNPNNQNGQGNQAPAQRQSQGNTLGNQGTQPIPDAIVMSCMTTQQAPITNQTQPGSRV